LLRVKIKQQKQGKKPLEQKQLYDKVMEMQNDEIKDISKRNA
jgi:hypothetical protein